MLSSQLRHLTLRVPGHVVALLGSAVVSLVVAIAPFGTASSLALAEPAFTTSSVATPNTVIMGQSVTIQSIVTSASATTALVDVEVYSEGGAKVGQKFWDNQTFGAGQTRTYSMTWAPTGGGGGTNQVKIGVFAPNWTALYTWNNSAALITVATPTNWGFAVALSSASVAAGGSISLTGSFTSPSATTVLVDIEIADSSGTRVGQQFWDNQTFSASQTRTYSLIWSVPATASGSYTSKLAVFSPNWVRFIQGNMSAATFSVTAAAPSMPAATSCVSSLQSLVDAAPPGSTVKAPPCTFRETVTIKKSLTLDGQGQAVIKGSDIWTQWSPSGSLFRSAQTVPTFSTRGVCAGADNLCLHAEQVFLDGNRLALNLSGTPGAGEFSLDSGRHVLLGTNPAGRTVEVTMRTRWIIPQIDGGTVANFTMAHAANDAQSGALSNADRANWTFANNRLLYAHGWILGLQNNTGLAAVNNEVAFAGQLGIGSSNTSGTLIRGNRIHDNNTGGFDPFWEAGGLKMALQASPVVDANEVSNNAGPGLWCDINCRNVALTNNRVHHNAMMGILFEISVGARICSNAVWSNGYGYNTWGWGGGIVVSSSANAEVCNNTLAWNADGISVISQNRPDAPSGGAVGNYVHDNVIAAQDNPNDPYNTLAMSWIMDWSGALFDAASNNRGAQDRFWFPTPEVGYTRYGWNGPRSTLAAFVATAGESNGSYLTTPQKDSLLAAAGIPTTPP